MSNCIVADAGRVRTSVMPGSPVTRGGECGGQRYSNAFEGGMGSEAAPGILTSDGCRTMLWSCCVMQVPGAWVSICLVVKIVH